MFVARIVVLVLALCAGGVAAYLASRPDNQPAPAPVAQQPTVEVLVAKSSIGLGQSVKLEDLQWQAWPASTSGKTFIRRSERPDATTQIIGAIARAPFTEGEPIREQKLVKADGSGFMAAILPTGMRAVSTEISAETGAGGFILPNDRVDVLLSKKPTGRGGQGAVLHSETVISNVRVLAIDQAPQEKDGQKTMVGKTVTLELKPEQAETLVAARTSGTLSLALRSIADINAVEDLSNSRPYDTVNVVRYGVMSSQAVQK